ncbi:MAG: trigger factor [Bacillota bacterium]|nr:trigger factor [Bacillota bacterium]
MDAKLEKIENSEAYLEIQIDAETFEEGLEKAYKKVVKQVAIPGFRKGRVPRQLLEAHFGQEVLYEDALEFVVPDAYQQAVEELKIDAIAQPDFEVVEVEGGKPVIFKARVAVKPEVTLGEIEGLQITVPLIEVSDDDVDSRLEDMRSRYAQIVEKEEEAVSGDTVTIDFKGFVDDVAFEGGEGTDYQLILGSDTFIPGFEEQLIGVKKNDAVDVKVTFPEEYHAEELASKEAVFKVTVKKVETKELRELNDEFAQEVSNFDTLEEMRADVKSNLLEMSSLKEKNMKREAAIIAALDVCEVTVAEAVVDAQLETMMEQMEQRMTSQGLSLEQYFQITGSTVEDFKRELRPEAETTAKTNFVLEKLAEEKGIEVSDEELHKEIENIAASMGMEVETAQENFAPILDKVIENLKMDKAMDYLVDHAVVTVAEETETEEAFVEEKE